MSITKATLRNNVLEHLGVLASGETANAADSATVEAMIDGVHAEMVTQEVAFWETSAIPDEVKLPLRDIVAKRAAKTFGATPNEAEEIMGWRSIRALTALKAGSEPVKATYY